MALESSRYALKDTGEKKNNTKLVIVKEKNKFLTWHAKNIKISFSFKKKNISGNKYINFQVSLMGLIHCFMEDL
jgi:hypothetical protein